MMKNLLKSWCKSTFMVLMVVALSSVAMAQFGNNERRSHSELGSGMGPVVPGSGSMTANSGQSVYNNLYEALKDQNVETTMMGAQLTPDWHIISSGELGIFAMLGAGRMMPQIVGFTQGKTAIFGNAKYLIAYYVQDQSDIQDLYSPSSNRSGKGYLFKDSMLSLALLPLNGNQSFYEIKKFDPQKDFISKAIVMRQESLANLKQIALGIFMYQQDYDGKMPPMVAARNADEIENHYLPNANISPVQILTTNIAAATTVQSRLLPYLKSTELFLQPATHRPYLPNYKVSRLPDSKIDNPITTFLFYEDAPDADGMRCVAYADGHAKALTEDEFQRERKAQGISESGYPPAAKTTPKAKAIPKA